MFSIEIDKFRRMLDLRRARYKHELETKFPNLAITYGDGTRSSETDIDKRETSLCLRVKADRVNLPFLECHIANNITYELHSDIILTAKNHIDSIYMYDDDRENLTIRKRTSSSLDMLWSYLFKTSVPEGLSEEEIFSRCLSHIDKKTSSGPLTLYTSYERSILGVGISNNVFTNAIVDLDLDIAGEATMNLLQNLQYDHERLAKLMFEKNEEQAKKWSF